MSGYLLFGANTSGSQIQRMQGLNHLTVSGKSVLQCTSLVASEDVSCNTAVIGDLTVSGNLQVRGNIAFSGALTVCNIFCPNDLIITAVSNIVMEAPTIRTTGNDVVLVGNNSIAAISGANTLFELDSATGGATIESTDLTVTTTATTSISSGENLLKSSAGTNISADDGTLDLISSGTSGSIIRIKTEPGFNASGSISIATTAAYPTTAGDSIAIDSASNIASRSATDTRITAGGASASSKGGIFLAPAATTTVGTDNQGDISLVPVSGDINLGDYTGDTNTVSPHLVVYGGESTAPTAAAGPGSSAAWVAAVFLTENSGGASRSGSTDTAGNVFVAGLPTVGAATIVIAAGDELILTFNRSYPSTYIHSLWQGMAAEAFGSDDDAAAAGAVLSLSAYYTTTQTGVGVASDITLTFLQNVTVGDITTIVPGYAGNLSFGYFNIDSVALE